MQTWFGQLCEFESLYLNISKQRFKVFSQWLFVVMRFEGQNRPTPPNIFKDAPLCHRPTGEVHVQ